MARASSLWIINRCPPVAASWSERPEFYTHDGENPIGVPIEGFADKTAAEAARKKLERAARETTPIGPFLRSRLPDGTGAIAAAAKAANVPPPDYAAAGPEAKPIRQGRSVTYPADYSAYMDRLELAVAAWWASVAADITPEANAILWNTLFPKFRFYSLSRVLVPA